MTRRCHFVAMMVIWGLFAGFSPPVSQALELSVYGTAQLEVDARAAGTTLVVEGRLADDVGHSLPSRPIEIDIRDGETSVETEEIYSDYEGRFATSLEMAPGTYEVVVSFAGTQHVSEASLRRSVDVERAPTQLRVDGPPWIHGSGGEVPIQIEATAGGVGLTSFVTVSVQGRPIFSVDLDSQGRTTLDIAGQLDVGPNQVAVEVPASTYRDAAEQSVVIRRVENGSLAGDTRSVFRRMTRGVEVAVELRDDWGPVEGVEIEIALERLDDDERLERLEQWVRVDDRGRAQALFSDADVGSHRWELSARASPPVGEPIVWRGEPVHSEPARWSIALRVLAFIVLVAGLIWVGRRVFKILWQRWRQWRAATADEESKPEESEQEMLARRESTPLHVGPIDDDSAGRDDQSVHLQLWDEWRDQPVPQAQIVIENESGTVFELQADESGVRLPTLADGHWDLLVRAPGYIDVETDLEMPIAEPSVRLLMTAVPLKIRRAYRWMVERTRGEDPWGRLTPREIRAALTKALRDTGDRRSAEFPEPRWDKTPEGWELDDALQDPDRLLEQITALVEETNFSGDHYGVEAWELAREMFRVAVESHHHEGSP